VIPGAPNWYGFDHPFWQRALAPSCGDFVLAREQLLDEFERSGLSGQQFAELVGIKYTTLATWAQERRRQCGASKAVKAPPFLQLMASRALRVAALRPSTPSFL
jgi:hypothetical protein